MKKIIFVTLILVCAFGLFGCDYNYPYRGPHKELYTTAIYSIPDAEGCMHHGEGAFDSQIYIWEQDDYGRTLFSYCEDYSAMIFSLVICQSYDEENVYFYPDINYKLTLLESESLYSGKDDDYLMTRTKDFYLESRDELKKDNDWDKPFDKTKCVAYQITDHKVLSEDLFSFGELECNEILNEYTKTLNFVNPESGPYRYDSILQVDAEGRILHEIYGVHRNFDNPEYDPNRYSSYGIFLWVITDKDGNYDKETGIMVMYSKVNGEYKFSYDAKDVLEFKNKNGWKTPNKVYD